MLDNEGSPYI